ncbi:ExeA family protein [Candidatus Entotheonella palauensis]|uniref:ExeA family protein n=1 Tax=Candidatus Entotheonella palauensis TaxID=93172 RepID=UPI0015C44757|nr:AAA family ATPase [Candidatus Entotheonella palauensis]
MLSAILGVIVLHKQIAPIQWCGGALILTSGYLWIRLSNHTPSRKAEPRLEALASTDALLDYYQFWHPPFHVSPDPDAACLSPSHEQALATIRYVIEARLGLVAILGETGVGKTMLIRTCMARMTYPQVKMIYFPHAQISFADILTQACHALDVEPRQTTIAALIRDLQGALIDAYRKERLVALIIDDVHHMPLETMQSLRLLLNLETPKAKLLQLVLCGHPAVEKIWNLADLEPLKQCLMMRVAIEPLTPAESRAYIQQRLSHVTRRLTPVFTDRALKRIVRHTAGIPRTINTVCNNALIEGFAYQHNPVSDAIVKRAMAHLAGLAPSPWLTHSLIFVLGFLAGIGLLAGLMFTPAVQGVALSLLQTLVR